jgi:hypothetical protein
MFINHEDFSNENLIPNTQNTTPDYYCTWQTQLFYTNDGKPTAQRASMCEKALFEQGYPTGWAYFYETARNDLFLVMDDSWDVPLDGNKQYYGSLVLNEEKFPSFAKGSSPEEALKQLSKKIMDLGWKALGGWICVQPSELFQNNMTDEAYWIERFKWAKEAKIGYWKADWGNKAADVSYRKMMTDLAKIHAPNLIIEHAIDANCIPYSDVFRTYDVPAILSIPMTMEKLSSCLLFQGEESYRALINCEDEAYIAAALGCSMGIMRHPYQGNFPNGKPDMSFPSVHRNLKTKMDEITRAVRWHRVAPAFSVKKENTFLSETKLTDTWKLEHAEAEIEQWWLKNPIIEPYLQNGTLEKSGTACISRGMQLPIVVPDSNDDVPFVVASKNPNGAVSIATLGRTKERDYYVPKCDIEILAEDACVFGIFGYYNTLTIHTNHDLNGAVIKAQDLMGNRSVHISTYVIIHRNQIVIPGNLIETIGTFDGHMDDTSEPGMILKIELL